LIGDAEHDLQTGEISSSFLRDEAGVKKLAIEGFGLSQGMGRATTPFINAGQVLLFFWCQEA